MFPKDSQINSPFGHDYILIIEWLNDPAEQKTGEDLAKWLRRDGRREVVFVPCAVESDVFAALEQAIIDLPTHGIPIVHFEAHGYDGNAADPGGLSDRSEHGGYIQWQELWVLLRRLNEATRFQLLVVAGACDGDNVMSGMVNSIETMWPEDPASVERAPFIVAAGFKGVIDEEDLRDAFREFYGSLFEDSAMDRAADAANGKLGTRGRFVWVWIGAVALRGMQRILEEHQIERAKRLLGRKLSARTLPNALATLRANDVALYRMMFERLLAFDLYPENRDRVPWANF